MEFINLGRQYEVIKYDVSERIQGVLDSQKFIMGKEVVELENSLASYTNRKYCLTCGSGTEALQIALMSYELERKDAVFVPAFTFFASAESIVLAGGTPVFVDCDESYNIDCENLEKKISNLDANLRAKGIIAVDLFGQCADYTEITKIADKYGLFIVEDGAQGFGGSDHNIKACKFGDISITSFFPAKPLGCYGDGGAIFTDDENKMDVMKSIRIHGMGSGRYDNVRIGLNGRMDTIQAAILLSKIEIFDDEVKKRNEIAKEYTKRLNNKYKTPFVKEGKISSWAQYSLLTDSYEHRKYIIEELSKSEIPCMIYYPIPLHLQSAFGYLNYKRGDLPKCEDYADRIFSIPMHPYLEEQEIDEICGKLINVH